MAQKIHPKGFRLGITHNYSTQWFTKNKNIYAEFVLQDNHIRQYLAHIYQNIIDITIQRTPAHQSTFSNNGSQCFVKVILAPTENLSKISPYSSKIIRMKGSMKMKKKANQPTLRDTKKIE